jgi:eukaryotic-like serine/threonine-protein kinase
MPLYARGSVQGLMNSRFLTAREVVKMGIEMLSGLQHIHSRGLLHLDVKPANLLLTDEGTVVVADFGCARPVDANMLADPLQMYPLHMVPERFKASKLGPEADIYQAGLTLYRMFNGDALFFEPIGGRKSAEEIKDQKIRNKVNEKIKKGAYPARDAYLPHVPKRLRAAILTALNPDPNQRYKTPAEFIDKLSSVDEALDWALIDGPAKTWMLDSPDSTIVIKAEAPDAKGRHEVVTSKTVKSSGNTQRVTRHCGMLGSVAEAHKFVATVATDLG